MKVVGLVSGGKDSCFNLMKCVENGHEIVCLANLHPPAGTHEMDSYMYQTVGHDAIHVYGEAWRLPLYRQEITGTPKDMGMNYQPTENDEVEDLVTLLNTVKKHHPDIQGVSAGAIWSSYQTLRVNNVCERLGLTPLCFLWEREQEGLMREMVEGGVDAILIKTATLGLNPTEHLGMSIRVFEQVPRLQRCLREALPHLVAMRDKYGLNVCGEGGEFETLVLDCPLFRKKILIQDSETVIHSPDPFAPVGYLKINKLCLQDK